MLRDDGLTADGVRLSETEANGIRFSFHEAGPADGALVLCLHGFPDTAWTWRHLLPDLGAAGFHAVAPFMRGYAPTSLAPDGRYPMGALVADVLALHEVLGGEGDSALIGHDWGAPAAYGAAAFEPGRFRKVVAGGVPPTMSFLQALFAFTQLKRSWYIFFFQTPLADGVVAADDLAFAGHLWKDWSPGYEGAFDLAKVRESLSTPERLGAALAYYRAMFDPSQEISGLEAQQTAAMQPVPQPTLYYHGLDDGCVGAEAITPAVLDHLGPGSRLLLVERAGHFAHLERPDIVNPEIVKWLTS
ncbi:MAG TPA: alpha/beta fold hydrolase [Acidimicrobiales bacterium]|nr:alpha/beta fold hydrolase [Acidimicrobiales bacterium]